MLQFNSKRDVVDYERYGDLYRSAGFVYVQEEDYLASLDGLRVKRQTLFTILRDEMIDYGFLNCYNLDKNSMLRFIKEYTYVPRYMIYTDGANGKKESIDKDKVIMKIIDAGYLPDFFLTYIDFVKLKSLMTRMGTLNKRFIPTDKVDYKGRAIYKLEYEVNQRSNLRFYTENYNIIGIPKQYSSMITVPDDEVIVAVDFPQADLKVALNLMFRGGSNDYLFNKYDDSYEALARMIAMHKGEKEEDFDIDLFKEERDLFKVNCLSPLNGGRKGSTTRGTEFIRECSAFYNSCPKYSNFVKDIKFRLNRNIPLTVKSYFGYENYIDGHSRGNGKDSPLNAATNSPFQTGTSEMVIPTALGILDRFYEKGFTEDDISLYLARHDEVLFRMKKSMMKHSWIFGDCSVLKIDDWKEIELEFDFYNQYKMFDENLNRQYLESCEANKDKYTSINNDLVKHYDYEPLSKMARCGIYIGSIGDKVLAVYYNSDTQEYDRELYNTSKKKDLFIQLLNKVLDKVIDVENPVDVVLVTNNIMDGMKDVGLTQVCLDLSDKIYLSPLGTISSFIESEYCKANNLSSYYTDSFFTEEKRDFLKTITRVKVF